MILKALEDTGAAGFSEYLHLEKSFQLVPKKRGEGYTKGKGLRLIEIFGWLNLMKTFEIGDFQIRSAPVDHSLPGAVGYIAENDEETIVYTGDLRFHGRQPELTKKFVEEASKAQPTVMLCEGTRIDSTENISEDDIEKSAVEEVNKCKGSGSSEFSST